MIINGIAYLIHLVVSSIKRQRLNNFYLQNPEKMRSETFKKFEVYLKAGKSPVSIKYFKSQQGLGPVTVGGYMRMLNKAIKDLGVLFPTHDEVTAYMVKLKDDGKSHSHRLNSRNLFMHYLSFLGDPIDIPRERKPKRVIKSYYTVEEIQKLLSVTKTVRERAIILTLVSSGLRVSELSNLTPRDIDLERRQIQVRQGKGSKDRVVNITPECSNILNQYIREKMIGEDSKIFSKQQIIRRTLKRIAKRTDIKKRIHPHGFRHSSATQLLVAGCDLITIQKHLGHSDVRTTAMVYLQVTDEMMKKKYDEFSPKYQLNQEPLTLVS